MKMFRIAAVGALAMLAGACLLTPGKFDAVLDIKRDGSFSYRYAGEIAFITPAAAAQAEEEKEQAFDPESQECFKDSEDLTEAEDRPCTAEEIAEFRRDWEQNQAASAERRKTEKEQMKALFGGFDPSDPKTVEQFTRRLQSYDGWKRVTHKGKGVFDVLYEKSGRIDHDFIFPVFPEIDWIIPFVHATRRTDGRIRVAAPAFVQPQGPGGMMGANAMANMNGSERAGLVSKPEGTFTLTTDMEVLTNNTENGPGAGAGGTKVLKWTVGPLDAKKPEALLKM